MFIVNPSNNLFNRGSVVILLSREAVDSDDVVQFLEGLDSNFDINGCEYHSFSAFDDNSILLHADESGDESEDDILLIGESARAFKTRNRDEMKRRMEGLQRILDGNSSRV